MPNIYIAGASAELERCEAFRDACVAMGYRVTFDWMANIRRVGAANEGVSDAEAIACAKKSDHGIEDADVFVLLLKPDGRASFGAAQEFGYARAVTIRPRLLVVGRNPSVFLRDVPHVDNDGEALGWLHAHLVLARKGGA